jgi:colanic acid biosynthesis glycosyl transferase WcaI
MRILIYSINYAPELTGIGKYNAEMAEWLAEKGHDVTVITAPPYYPWWKVQVPYRSWAYSTERINKVRVYRCPLWVPRHQSGTKRLLHLFSFALSSVPLLLLQALKRQDVFIILEPTFFCVPAALGVARLSGAHAWLHVQDLEVDAAFDLGLLPNGYLRQTVIFFERQLMRLFDRVSSISTNMLSRLVLKGVKQERTVLFPNWVDINAIFPAKGPSLMREELGIPTDSVVALYSGNMGEKQGLDKVLEAAEQLIHQTGLRIIFCGDGAARAKLKKSYTHLPNVTWMALQPVEKLNDLLNMADIHLLPQSADVADLVMPSKLTGMLASGKPVIATAHAGTRLAKVVSSCGIVVAPGNTIELVQSLLRLAQDKDMRMGLGNAARVYAEKHMAIDLVLNRFEWNLNRLLSKAEINNT